MKRELLVVVGFCFISFWNQSMAQLGFYPRYGQDSCEFDSACTLMTMLPIGGLWEQTKPATPFFSLACPSCNALITESDSFYPDNLNASFELHVLNYSYSNIALTFWHRYETEKGKDGGRIEVSFDKGITWRNIFQLKNGVIPELVVSSNFYSNEDTLFDGEPGFSGKSSDTVESDIHIIWQFPMKNIPDTVYFRFSFLSDSFSQEKEGWMIDKFLVSIADLGSGIHPESGLHPRLFPNPAGDKIQCVLLEEVSGFDLKIYDLSGKCLRELKVDGNEIEIDLSELPAGTLFYSLLSPEGSTAQGRFIHSH